MDHRLALSTGGEPRSNSKVRRGSPLTRGLIRAFVHSGPNYVDLTGANRLRAAPVNKPGGLVTTQGLSSFSMTGVNNLSPTVDIGEAISLNEMSFVCWCVNAHTSFSNFSAAFGYSNSSGRSSRLLYQSGVAGYRFIVGNGAEFANADGGDLKTGELQCLVGTLTTGDADYTAKLYQNGVEAGSSTKTGAPSLVTNNFRIGDNTGIAGRSDWNGGVFVVLVYDRCLPPADVRRLYQPSTRWDWLEPAVRVPTLGSAPSVVVSGTATLAGGGGATITIRKCASGATAIGSISGIVVLSAKGAVEVSGLGAMAAVNSTATKCVAVAAAAAAAVALSGSTAKVARAAASIAGGGVVSSTGGIANGVAVVLGAGGAVLAAVSKIAGIDASIAGGGVVSGTGGIANGITVVMGAEASAAVSVAKVARGAASLEAAAALTSLLGKIGKSAAALSAASSFAVGVRKSVPVQALLSAGGDVTAAGGQGPAVAFSETVSLDAVFDPIIELTAVLEAE